MVIYGRVFRNALIQRIKLQVPPYHTEVVSLSIIIDHQDSFYPLTLSHSNNAKDLMLIFLENAGTWSLKMHDLLQLLLVGITKHSISWSVLLIIVIFDRSSTIHPIASPCEPPSFSYMLCCATQV